jgi:hypothetical protein
MAVLQNTYTETFGVGYPGAAGNGENSNDITLTLEGATACAFGRAVYRGVADKGATLTPSANLRGFALRQQGLSETSTRPADSYAPNDNMAVRERGSIYITSATAAADGDPVFVTPAGLVSNSAAGNTAATGWVYDQTITAAGVALIVRR